MPFNTLIIYDVLAVATFTHVRQIECKKVIIERLCVNWDFDTIFTSEINVNPMYDKLRTILSTQS